MTRDKDVNLVNMLQCWTYMYDYKIPPGLPLVEVWESFTHNFSLWLSKFKAFPSLIIYCDFQILWLGSLRLPDFET